MNKKHPKKQTLKSLVIKDFKDVIRMFTIHHSLIYKPLLDTKYLVYDENKTIIGYK